MYRSQLNSPVCRQPMARVYFSPPASLEHVKVGWDAPGLETRPVFQADCQPLVLL